MGANQSRVKSLKLGGVRLYTSLLINIKKFTTLQHASNRGANALIINLLRIRMIFII